MSVRNRELSQFGSFINIDNSNQNIGITSSPTPYVGIGTNSPQSKLHVEGDAKVSGVVTASAFVGDGSALTNLPVGGNYSQWVDVASGIQTSSNVGIGTEDPTSKLHVIGDVNISGIITAAFLYGNLVGTATSASVATTAYNLSNAENITTGIVSTSRLSGAYDINITGIASYSNISGISTNVIGGISSVTQIQVTGISTFLNGPAFIGSGTSTGTASQTLQVTGGTYISGNLGIGTTNPSSKLHVVGNVDSELYKIQGTNVIDGNRSLLNISSFDSTVTSIWDSVTTTSVSKGLVNRENCTVTDPGTTITLPSSPSAGWEVAINVGNFINTIIARNGSNIMGLAEDLTVNIAYASLNFVYSGDATQGWRLY